MTMDDLPSETSPGMDGRLPDDWIERIFEIMENRYLSRWTDSFGALSRARVKAQWSAELAGFSPEQIKRGLSVDKAWPPTLPEFKLLCRPANDLKADWAEAIEQMRVRLGGRGGDVWSRPEVYWAAVSIGWYDLNNTAWDQIKGRWARALETAKTDPVPEFRAALPKPGQQTVTREQAAERMAQIRKSVEAISAVTPSKAWAYRLLAREAKGEKIDMVSADAWREALGQPRNADARLVFDSLTAETQP